MNLDISKFVGFSALALSVFWTLGCQSTPSINKSNIRKEITLKKADGKFYVSTQNSNTFTEFPDFNTVWKMAHFAHGTFNDKMRRMIREYDKPIPERRSIANRTRKYFADSREVFQLSNTIRIQPETTPASFNQAVEEFATLLDHAEDFERTIKDTGHGEKVFAILEAFLRAETPNDKFLPVHVSENTSLELQIFEMTQEDFVRLFGFNPSNFSEPDFCVAGGAKYVELSAAPMCAEFPVESISWTDLQVLLKILNTRSALYRYSLPTIDDWTNAIGTEKLRDELSNSPRLEEFAWWILNSHKHTHAVGTRKPMGAGFFDLLGNVWEIMEDPLPGNENMAAMRGGSWGSIHRGALRIENIRELEKNFRGYQIGFRLKRTKKTKS